MVTIKDIAKKVKVDTSTVSYVLSGNTKRASEATRRKILKAAREMNYHPNLLARGLIKKKSSMIGLLIGDFSNPYFTETVKGIHDACQSHKIKLLVGYPVGSLQSEIEHFRSMMEYQVEGIIFCPSYHYHDATDALWREYRECLAQIEKMGIKLVSIASSSSHKDALSICYDYQLGTAAAMDHLIGLGHRKIAFITPVYDRNIVNDRLEYYKQALRKHKIRFLARWVAECRNERRAAYEATRRLFENNPDITALFSFNDYMAVAAIRALKDMGLRVPEDVAVVGFDDIEEVSYIDPPLTTIRLEKYGLGEIILNHIRQTGKLRQEERVILLKPRLIVRQSSGAPRV